MVDDIISKNAPSDGIELERMESGRPLLIQRNHNNSPAKTDEIISPLPLIIEEPVQ